MIRLVRRVLARLGLACHARPGVAAWELTTVPCRISDAMHADSCPGQHLALRCERCGYVVAVSHPKLGGIVR